MKKILSIFTICAFLFIGANVAFATCEGPECSQSGKIDMDVFAAGGAIDAYGRLIPNGAAGSVAAAGGIGAGQAKGGSFFGKVEGEIGVTAGGIIIGDSYKMSRLKGFDKSIGVGSWAHGDAEAGGYLGLKALGFSGATGAFGSVAGQGTLSGSVLGGSPLNEWDSKGITYGVAGQFAAGHVEGYVGTALFGYGDVAGDIYMSGETESQSYRGITYLGGGYKVETMGTNVRANTNVNSFENKYACGITIADISGGYVAAGAATSVTVMAVEGGVGFAKASGAYAGSGELGCNFEGSLDGGTQVNVTTLSGRSGSIVSSSARMAVSVK